MAATDFYVSYSVKQFYFEGNPMLKFKIRGNQRNRVKAMLKWTDAIIANDNKPPSQSSNTPKVYIFDASITGLTAAVTAVRARLVDLLAKIP